MDCSQITGPLCGNYGSPNRTLMPIFWYQKMVFWDQKFDFLREYSSSFLWIPNTKGQCEWYRDLMVALLLFLTSQWRHNGRDDVSNHQPHDCLLNRIFRHRWKKTSKLRVTGLWEIQRWPITSPYKGPVTRKMFPFDDVIMDKLCNIQPNGRWMKRPIAHLTPLWWNGIDFMTHNGCHYIDG